MRDVTPGGGPSRVVAGDPDVLRAAAGSLSTAAEALAEAVALARGAEVDPAGWWGRGASAFSTALASLVQGFEVACGACLAASGSLASYAAALEEAAPLNALADQLAAEAAMVAAMSFTEIAEAARTALALASSPVLRASASAGVVTEALGDLWSLVDAESDRGASTPVAELAGVEVPMAVAAAVDAYTGAEVPSPQTRAEAIEDYIGAAAGATPAAQKAIGAWETASHPLFQDALFVDGPVFAEALGSLACLLGPEACTADESGLTEIGDEAAGEDDLPPLKLEPRQVESKFKHAVDFGVTEDRGAAGFRAFAARLNEFVTAPATVRTLGTYRGDPAILNYDVVTREVVIQALDGTFVSGWQMTRDQLEGVLTRRSLGLG